MIYVSKKTSHFLGLLGLSIGMALFASAWALADSGKLASVEESFAVLVNESTQEYSRTVAQIAEEKAPLVRRVGQLENQNIEMRLELNRFKRIAEEGRVEADAFSKRDKELSAQTDYIARLLEEYLLKFESRLHLGEDQKYKASLTQARQQLDSPRIGLGDSIDQYLSVVEIGLSRQEEIIGGYSFLGKAIDETGNVLDGQVVVCGPAAYFSANGDGASGVLRFHSGTIEPEVVSLGGDAKAGLSQLATTGSGLLFLDSSLGDALSLDQANLTFSDHIKQGGNVGYTILALGGIALILGILKFGDLGRFSLATPSDIRAITETAKSGKKDEALKQAEGISGAVGDVIKMGVRNIGANSVLMEDMMLSVILKKRPEMERFMPFLAITAAASPLLGLLGTVVGMIKTFALITVFGTGDPQALSSGISEALVTTELGLIVAIPTLILHGLFTRMIKSRLGMMEQVAFDFVKLVTTRKPEGAGA